MTLGDAWEANAAAWVVWARAPGHDSYWRFHRDLFLELVPPPGRLTLDVGCGEGRVARDLKALGHRVVALDASPTMVAAAREADPELEVHLADAAALPFPDGAADLVVAFMSLQDVNDFEAAIAEAGRVLEPGGRLCLAIVHPLNSAGTFEGDAVDAPFVIRGSYLGRAANDDMVEHDGLEMRFHSEHRPLQDYAEALAAAGILVERLREPAMPEHGFRSPESARWQRVPLFLHLRAVRP
jgi:SAM-dependent methyltransferase